MKATVQEQKNEAIRRMKLLKLHENPIREFEEKGRLNLSENGGILYWLDEKQQEYVKEFERKYNGLVYHVIRDFRECGETLSFLYVTDSAREWEYDRDDLKQGYAFAYVKNLDDDLCSEFGSIGIKPQFGGLVRTM